MIPKRRVTSSFIFFPLTHITQEKNPQNISSEVMEVFRLVQDVINRSGLVERCKNLDKRREKFYWTLPEELMARAFEVT